MRLKKRKFDRTLKKSQTSNVARSSRRFVFNFQDDTSSGKFYSDTMYGSGSGVLIKFKGTFFVLTAQHVLRDWAPVEGDGYQNDSPFWIQTSNKPIDDGYKQFDFLYPKKVWSLSEKIRHSSHFVDEQDVVLIELFPPPRFHQPDNYLDFDHKLRIASARDLQVGALLLISGFPDTTNYFSYDDPPEGYTHSTTFQRRIIPGILQKDEDYYISLEYSDGGPYNNAELKGFSGGLVCDVQLKSNSVRFVGLILSGDNEKMRFLPGWAIEKALHEYTECSNHNADPRADGPLSPLEFQKAMHLIMDYEKAHDSKDKDWLADLESALTQ